jgi:hypothetical protein
MGELSDHIIRPPTDGSHLQTFVHSVYASARVRTDPKKLSPVAKGGLA